MTNKIHLNSLMIKALNRILELEPFQISMCTYTDLTFTNHRKGMRPNHQPDDYYTVSKHPCGTAYCLAGKMAADDGYPEKYRIPTNLDFFDHTEYVYDHLGFNVDTFDFIFGGLWPDDLDQAKLRAKIMLENSGEISFRKFFFDKYFDTLKSRGVLMGEYIKKEFEDEDDGY